MVLPMLCLSTMVSGQGAPVSSTKAGETCPFLDGVFVSVMRRIFSQGFHKQLLSEVELMLTTTLLPDNCQLLVEETMPRGAYVDPDEMRDLRFKTGLRSFIPIHPFCPIRGLLLFFCTPKGISFLKLLDFKHLFYVIYL